MESEIGILVRDADDLDPQIGSITVVSGPVLRAALIQSLGLGLSLPLLRQGRCGDTNPRRTPANPGTD